MLSKKPAKIKALRRIAAYLLSLPRRTNRLLPQLRLIYWCFLGKQLKVKINITNKTYGKDDREIKLS